MNREDDVRTAREKVCMEGGATWKLE